MRYCLDFQRLRYPRVKARLYSSLARTESSYSLNLSATQIQLHFQPSSSAYTAALPPEAPSILCFLSPLPPAPPACFRSSSLTYATPKYCCDFAASPSLSCSLRLDTCAAMFHHRHLIALTILEVRVPYGIPLSPSSAPSASESDPSSQSSEF